MRMLVIAATIVLITGCDRHPDEPAPVANDANLTVREVMREKIEPAAQVFWHSSGTVDTDKGTIDLAPTSPDGWAKAETSMDDVISGARLLMDRKRAKDQGDWMGHANDLIKQAKLAREAVRAKNKDKMFETGGELYAVCTDCHRQYLLPYLGPDGRPKKIDENGSPISLPVAPPVK